MMQKYDSYKDSGVQWLGEIPSHWEVVPLKYYSNIIMGQSPNGDDITDNGQLLFMQGNAEFGNRYPHPTSYCDKCSKKSRVGDILMSVRAPVGALNISDRVYGIGRGLCSIRAINVERDFLWYYLIVARNGFKLVSTGSTYDSVSMDTLCGIKLVVPSLPEQQAIAAYLDEQTAKIDTAIAQQQKMIDLLNERKQIIINRAVTKGLNPNVKMKDSGVEWIGEVPEHWEIKKLKHVCKAYGRIGFRGYSITDLVDEGEGCITLSPSNMREGRMKYDKCTYLSWEKYEESPEIKINNGDILFVKTGSTYGKCSLVHDLPIEATINPQLLVFKDIQCNNIYLTNILQTSLIKSQVEITVIGGTIPTISQSKILNYMFPYAPISEQEEIVTFIDRTSEPINAAIKTAEKQIALLQERKQIIINDVVTGKVKVK